MTDRLIALAMLCGGLAMVLAGVKGWRASRRRIAELDDLLKTTRAPEPPTAQGR